MLKFGVENKLQTFLLSINRQTAINNPIWLTYMY